MKFKTDYKHNKTIMQNKISQKTHTVMAVLDLSTAVPFPQPGFFLFSKF